MTIVPLERRRLGEAARMLARAFHEDPTSRSLWPDPRRRPRALRAFMALPLADALGHGHVDAALDGDAIAGVAAWYPAGAYPSDTRRQLRAMPRVLGVAAAAPRAFSRLARLGLNIDAAFPDDRPSYLAVIGIAPEAQGRGIGSRLIETGLARVDGPCYLETDTEGGMRLYERHGFEVIERAAQLLPGGPTHWRMLRRAQG